MRSGNATRVITILSKILLPHCAQYQLCSLQNYSFSYLLNKCFLLISFQFHLGCCLAKMKIFFMIFLACLNPTSATQGILKYILADSGFFLNFLY